MIKVFKHIPAGGGSGGTSGGTSGGSGSSGGNITNISGSVSTSSPRSKKVHSGLLYRCTRARAQEYVGQGARIPAKVYGNVGL